MDLEEALGQFEKAETNVSRIEAVAEEMAALVPDGISFADASPEAERYENLRRSYVDLLSGLPPLNGYNPSAVPLTLDEIADRRMGVAELGEPEYAISIAQEEHEPAEQLAEYKHRFAKARRSLVRERVLELVKEIDSILSSVDESIPRDGTPMADNEEWQRLIKGIGEIERLLGSDLSKSQIAVLVYIDELASEALLDFVDDDFLVEQVVLFQSVDHPFGNVLRSGHDTPPLMEHSIPSTSKPQAKEFRYTPFS